jgi:hypothetical protein
MAFHAVPFEKPDVFLFVTSDAAARILLWHGKPALISVVPTGLKDNKIKNGWLFCRLLPRQ